MLRHSPGHSRAGDGSRGRRRGPSRKDEIEAVTSGTLSQRSLTTACLVNRLAPRGGPALNSRFAMRPARLQSLITFIRLFKEQNPAAVKEDVQAAIEAQFAVVKQRSVYLLEDGALRVSESNVGSFSNVVLSLSTLQKYDHVPVVVVVVRPDGVGFLLANSTFLKRVSHSSHRLAVDNVKGSFLGHDILREFDGIANRPENIEALFSLHQDVTWEENLIRLVESTTAIAPTGRRFEPTEEQVTCVMAAPDLASRTLSSTAYGEIETRLTRSVEARAAEILQAARIENVNLRGNTIERIITEAGNLHGLSDLHFELGGGLELIVDVKTKLLHLASSPKLYNIDRALRFLASGGGLFSLLLVGIDTRSGFVRPRLVSIFDRVVVSATRIQFHWAGRASRGVTQLTGDVARCFQDDFRPEIAIEESRVLLKSFLDLTA